MLDNSVCTLKFSMLQKVTRPDSMVEFSSVMVILEQFNAVVGSNDVGSCCRCCPLGWGPVAQHYRKVLLVYLGSSGI